MVVTVALVAGAGVAWLGLPLGAAILLGGMLAPTDPVLASDVQVAEPIDRDRLRFALTGEAGLNDGTAFPFVLLGLGLLGLHDLGNSLWRWVAVDVVWAVAAGIGVGAALGTLVGRLVLYLRRTHKEAVGLDNFLALGLIGLAYGLASLAHGYGFLAVFAAGVALRRIEQQASAGAEPRRRRRRRPPRRSAAPALGRRRREGARRSRRLARRAGGTDPKHAPAYMAHAVLSFNEQIERIGEVVAVIAVGMLLWAVDWPRVSWPFVALLLLVIRPMSVVVGLARSKTSASQHGLIGWFGIRGIGSLYYWRTRSTTACAGHGGDDGRARLSVVVVSIVVHGISVTPLMKLYERRSPRRERRRDAGDVARAQPPKAGAGALAEAWFAGRRWQPFAFQREVWAAMAAGQSGLLHATTGSGKTYAVWFGALARAAALGVPLRGASAPPLGVLWLTPMRALAADSARAMRAPLDELGLSWSIGVRTGDTTPAERARQDRRFPTALVTTPESLSLMLTREAAKDELAAIHTVIVDEWTS